MKSLAKPQLELKSLLMDHGIRPSVQRVLILDYLISVTSHPSADTVFEQLADKIPSLSKATVYNTLNLFAERGVARMITVDPAEKRFDGNIATHGHFRCSICGKLEDVLLEDNGKNINFNTVHKVFYTDIYLNGICVNCQTKE